MSVKKIPDFIEKRLLEEYKELGLCWRHDDEMFSKLTAVLLPLSIAALTLPYLRAGTPKLLAAAGGLMLITFWFLSYLIHKSRFEIRFSRIHEIEWILGLDSHLRYERESTKRRLKDQHLRYGVFIVYLVVALFVTCDINVTRETDTKVEATLETIDVWTSPDLWPTDAWVIKFVITTETIVCFIIVGIVGYLGRKYRYRYPENKA